jgi:cytochrome c oxidase assembly factor CtaG
VTALPAPSAAGLLERWSIQPLALVAAIAGLGWYLWSVSRLTQAWPRRRTVTFVIGIAAMAWTTNGFLETYECFLFWAWTAQYLTLLLVVPVLIMAGQPIELARRVHGERSVRFVHTGLGRFFTSPLVGPALIPILSVVLFFGPLPRWAISQTWLGWTLELAVAAIGALIVLPLVGVGDESGSLAVALALLIGVFELLLDAVPGIVLRLSNHSVTSYFDHRRVASWTPKMLHDQQLGGATLWVVAELIDLPFLVLIYWRWIKADARDAAVIDTVLDAERIARGEDSEDAPTDVPWWLSDPAMRRRLGR